MIWNFTDAEYAAYLHRECTTGDTERDHHHADIMIANLLRQLGYTETADAYDALCEDFWYA
jgi:hypothetical protein